jgi:hypothetical protein
MVRKAVTMPITRRTALLGIGLAGTSKASMLQPEDVTEMSPDTAKQQRHATDDPVAQIPYIAPFQGSRSRPLNARLGQVLSALDFGAAGDGETDDTQALQAAADAAAATGKPLFLPATRKGYLVTETIEVRCRRVIGDANFLDSTNPGTLIIFRPKVFDDLKPCFALLTGMYGGGEIQHITVEGPTFYRRESLSAFVNPSLLPEYKAFVSGVCAFAVCGSNQPIFRNVSTRNVKVGLFLDSKNGHVSSYDCIWNGLIGVYCHRNSEDYFFTGGQITGIFAGVVFGTFSHANHNGGFSVAMQRVHMGFSPFGFYQVRDASSKGVCLTVSGRLDFVRFERIGEAIFKFLPESITHDLAIDSFGMSWSPIYKGYPHAAPSGWYTNLPPDIMAYESQQRHMFIFGTLGRDVRLSWLGQSGGLRRSQYADNSGSLVHAEQLDCGDSTDLWAFGGDIEVAGATRPDSWTKVGTGPLVRTGDLVQDSAISPAGNLLATPEVIANWQKAGPGGPNASVSTGSLPDVISRMIPSVGGNALPANYLYELGAKPTVITLMAGQGQTVFLLPFSAGPVDPAGRALYLSLWVTGAPVGVRIKLESSAAFYGQTINATRRWERVIAVDQIPPEHLSALVIELPAGTECHIAGAMATFGGPRPYNPRRIPRIRGGVAFDEFPLSGAAAVPEKPAGFLVVEIDGKPRNIPYY